MGEKGNSVCLFFLSKYNLICVVHFCHLLYYWLIFFSRCGQNSNALTAGWTKVSLNAVCRLNRCFGSNILWIIIMSWNPSYAHIAWLSTSFKMDAVRGVDTILETESQVQGERKGTMRCHVVAVTVIIMTTMNIMTTIIISITSITMITTNNDQDKEYYSSYSKTNLRDKTRVYSFEYIQNKTFRYKSLRNLKSSRCPL